MAVKSDLRKRKKTVDPYKVIKTLKCRDIRNIMGHCLVEYLNMFEATKIK